MAVTPAIPASQIVSVVPSVLSAGGNALDLIGLVLDDEGPFGVPGRIVYRIPTGQVLSFPTAAAVASYFGPTSQEAALAAIYFLGFNGSNVKPGALLFWHYDWLYQVGAWLRGGNVSGLSIQQLQALSGTLTIEIDASQYSANINLSGATSFSNAAEIIGNALGIQGPSQGSYTASLSGTVMTVSAVINGPRQALVTASLSGTVMTVTAVTDGVLAVGQVVTGTGISPGTTISSFGTGAGGTGTYNLSASVSTESGETIDAYAPGGALGVGSVLSGTGIPSGTYIASLGTGAGGTGTYNLSGAVSTESGETVLAYQPGVVYDSVGGGFVVVSPGTGTSESITYASGALATSLLLTQALGAVISQGAGLSTPAGDLDDIIAITQNWFTFFTTFEPVTSDKVAFASWTNGQGSGAEYAYAMWDTSVQNTQSDGPSPAVAAITNAGYSGTELLYTNPAVDTLRNGSPGGQMAALLAGYAASVDFAETEGSSTMAFKSQTGIPPHVVNATAAQYLLSYDMSFYGDYTTPNQAFVFLYNGSITGTFLFIQFYMNQVWLDNQIQLAMMLLLTSIKSLPYNPYGYGLIDAAMLDPIQAALNFGAIQPGVTLSNEQAAVVNAEAGAVVAPIIQNRGWYFQVQDAAPAVRAAGGSPPCTLWYTSGGAILKINIASILIQ